MFTVQFRRENFTKSITWKLWKFWHCFSWQSVILLWFVDLMMFFSHYSSTHNFHTCIQTATNTIDYVNITNINKKIGNIEFAYLNTKDGTIVNLTLIFFQPVETMSMSLSLRRADGEVKPGVYDTNLYTKPLFRHQMEISELVDGKKGNFLTSTVGGAILKMSQPPIHFPVPAGAYKFINVVIPSPIQFKLFYYNNMKYYSTLKDNPNKKVMTSEWHVFGRNFWRSSLMYRQSSHGKIHWQFGSEHEKFISSNYKDKQHKFSDSAKISIFLTRHQHRHSPRSPIVIVHCARVIGWSFTFPIVVSRWLSPISSAQLTAIVIILNKASLEMWNLTSHRLRDPIRRVVGHRSLWGDRWASWMEIIPTVDGFGVLSATQCSAESQPHSINCTLIFHFNRLSFSPPHIMHFCTISLHRAWQERKWEKIN